MTCYYKTHGNTVDVWDHEGNLVDTVEFAGYYSGDFPDVVMDVLYEAREGSQPSSYNQELLFCLAAEKIEEGPPSE